MSKSSEIRIGISGVDYAPWRGVFYPKSLRRSSEAELAYASRQLRTIEINGSFYALQRPESYERWYRSTPDDFVFSVKATRFITHVRRLIGIEKPLANFMASGPLALEEKLGPILWQFPPSFRYDEEKLRRFVELLPQDTAQASRLAKKHDSWMKGRSRIRSGQHGKLRPIRHTIEVRNETFRNPAFFGLLRDHGIALVISHSSDAWPMYEEFTSDFVYARLHGEGELYSGGYGDRALKSWERKIRNWTSGRESRDVYLYFDNDTKVQAPFDAMNLADRLCDLQHDLAV